MENKDNSYTTSDMYLFSYLRAIGYKYQNLEYREDRVWFVFERDGEMEEYIDAYFNGENIEISPRDFVNAIKDAKSLTHQYISSKKNGRT